LLQHDLLENLRQCITAGIRAVLLQFCNRHWMWIEKMAQRGIASDQNNSLERRTGAALLQKPEQTLNRDVDYRLRSLFAGSAVQNMGDSLHGPAHHVTVRNAPLDDFQPAARLQGSVMTQRANTHIAAITGIENAMDKLRTDLARRSGDQDALHTFRNFPSCNSVNACCSCSCVFMTIGPYHATGSSSGFPDTRRNRIPSSPAFTVTSSPRSKRMSERL